MWVVEPSGPRGAGNRAMNAGSSRPARNSGVRCAWVSSITSTSRLIDGGPGSASSSDRAWAIRIPPADGGGLVITSRRGTRLAPAARRHRVRRQVGGRQHPPRSHTQATIAARDIAVVERARALGSEPLERLGQLWLTDLVARAQQCTVGREQRRRLGRRGDDPGEDLDHVRLLGVELDAIAGERRGGLDELAQRDPAEPRGRLADPAGIAVRCRPKRRRC